MNNKIEVIKQKILPILKKNNVTRAGIFGSYARGEQRKKSDIDILIKLNDDRGLIEFIALKNTLERAIQLKVDLIEYDCLRPEIKKQVLKEEIPLLR